MGWYYGNASRKSLISELLEPNSNGSKPVAHTARGNVLWSVWESKDGARWIRCDLMQRSGGEWGYKPMDESDGPFYYTCPLSYLDMAPEVNAEWRVKVREYHAKQAANRKKAPERGEKWALVGSKVKAVQITSVGNQIYGIDLDTGIGYRIPRRFLGERIS